MNTSMYQDYKNQVCKISGKEIKISEKEWELRTTIWSGKPQKLPKYVFQQLWAFWWHFSIHKRKCSFSWKKIISVFGEDCPFPVWEKSQWVKNANPPSWIYNFNKWFFEQAWELFQKCPIAHNVWVWNENCDYTDDWWHSKNCYLWHSWLNCEDIQYCYRVLDLKNCQYCVFCFDCELCLDLINSRNCYNVKYAINSRNCRDSSFLFDCRNCEDCMYCWNLRNKKYCIANEQYSKEEYEKEVAKFDLSLRSNYETAKQRFLGLIKTKAWWANLNNENTENSTWDYLENTKNCMDCYQFQNSEDCANTLRWWWNKDNVDTIGGMRTQNV